MIFTIFTATFNRAHLLPKLFESLKEQTYTDFEWIVVDDGSSDNTAEVMNSFISQNNLFNIKYIQQRNSGKHIAINKGVSEAEGDLFFVVDSDDYIGKDALEILKREWLLIESDPEFAGLAGNKCNFSGVAIGDPAYNTLDCSPLDFRYKFNGKGDKCEVIRTSVFKMYPFPNTPDERFCPEALFFNRLKNFKLRYFNENLYFCEYLPEGLTAKIFKIRKDSPINTCICYLELAESEIPFKDSFKAMINFYRFKRYTAALIRSPRHNLFTRNLARSIAAGIYLIADKKKV
ncbi:glycosyltransferase family A protein [Pedobacter sp. MC2016-15]|uniref:glycosyltransferase family 2 protein n=1 Tax=Pedobacter sp. MC2016-15 TaxID=2994473 RepID=UPI002248274E|nr:glycosyltransferase family A protein [Pedobacter sp. MC2016-15]MCX2481807.1 glycosyltransferase family A protein [Pedobacter sp. MC2016-15]